MITFSFQAGGAFGIVGFPEGVAVSIYFHDEPGFMALEVYDVGAKGMLPPKFVAA